MATEGVRDEQLMQALDTIDREARVAGARGLPSVDVEELCPAYRNLRPALDVVANVVGAIPVWGGRAATGIRFAMRVADLACPVESNDASTQPEPA